MLMITLYAKIQASLLVIASILPTRPAAHGPSSSTYINSLPSASIKICHEVLKLTKINIFSFVLPFLLKATYDVFSSPSTSDEPEISEPHTGTPSLFFFFFFWMPGIVTIFAE